MKVFISPRFGKENAQGGIKRVVEAQEKYFPKLDIEITDAPQKADLVAVHGTEYVQHENIVAHNHGLYWDGYPWAAWAHKANERLLKIMKEAKAVTTPSHWVANSIRRGTLRDPVVCPHGIDLDEWGPPKKRQNYVIWAKTRADPVCNPLDMNKIAELAPGIRFVSTFGREADNITLVGALPFHDIKPLIQHATIYLATVRETGGITVLEAMASGVVPLGWRYGVNPEIVEHRVTGYLAKPGDYEDLLEGLNYCLQNQQELSDNARQAIVENHQWDHVITRYRDVYEQALQPTLEGPAVSIIVTAYNLDQFLPDCIESVLSQDYQDWELLIVDDASPDNCGRIADEYAEKDARIKVVHNKTNLYLAEARNTALRLARGRYCMPLDADDKLAPDALKLLAGALDRDTTIDIVTGSMQVVEEDGVTPWSQLARSGGISGWPTRHLSFNEQIRYHNQVPYASMYRRWVWERTGGYRRRYKTAEDADFWTRGMSFGAVPVKVTDKPTLIYRNRDSSMSHKEAAIQWTDWFTWAKYEELTPYAASGDPPRDELFWPVHAYGPNEVSIVIPCGPGHDWYLQDALDSLVAQTFINWECIVVNDTGVPWFQGEELINPYLAGFPWAKIIDSEGPPNGVAWARTTGAAAAEAPLLFFLDADDYLQPAALDILVKVQQKSGGWVYSDWYDQFFQHKEAQEWDADGLTVKMLGPMTGLYPRDAVVAVGFEDFGGWEDWDMQLSLLERGICGTRVALPLFVYRYHTGTRREDNFGKSKDLLQYIVTKHHSLYKENDVMAGCRKCGSGGGKKNVSINTSRAKSTVPKTETEMVLLEYVGPMTQFQRVKSRIKPGTSYRFGGNPGAASRKFFVFNPDATFLTQSASYRIVPQELEPESSSPIDDLPVLRADTKMTPPAFEEFIFERDIPEDHPVSLLDIKPETISILEGAGLTTVEMIQPLSVAQLVAIKGIGPARAAQILAAAKEVLGDF